ncbi:hypothetical protein RFI_17525 [Reticulomyxa filosa]|uniref:DNA replication licensing factor MCM6 n=1 Tax=Reticulomyxa filosa TaxID=46433 RepID=X6N309_RETFI|nr:hypothetical protein RFI_17525 [Reticulomyxa filosa]|eukprot:ETO19702.1 hypothetical protein RFI_17525 [Reticulomyxa filosa]
MPDYVQNTDLNAGENKDFSVSIMNFPDISALRDLRTSKIGQLCSVSGTVTRTSEVRPELLFGTFECMECRNIEKYVKQQFKYTEKATNWKVCVMMDTTASSVYQSTMSKPSEMDVGCREKQVCRLAKGPHPRELVILRGECVETCKPGDNATFTGTLIVVPDVGQFYSRGSIMFRSSQNAGPSEGVTGIKALGVRELNYKLVFLANHVSFSHKQVSCANNSPCKKKNKTFRMSNHNCSNMGQSDIRGDEEEKKITETLTESERADIIQMAQSSQLYDRLAKSIAPNIFGTM